ncbi:uncharacterized protein JN550_002490 [Neoarthrinium moseri]|uniref:uncharacterized protein n=1 Tax=Neoarthrinium moseri TaxID=1658444 RepID=UPI001FDCF464|nr:uncharacterized protein JN550_002490 [Neoarthrinium moseri]KAI1875061.1 hypothetical protein JN550_002490 [Neoarthrinium moseri]
MPPKKVSSDTLYVISSFIWDDDDTIEGLQPVEAYSTLKAANAAAKEMMFRFAQKLNPYGDVDEYDYQHEQDDNGMYHGYMEGGPHGHVAARVRVFATSLKNDSGRGAGKAALKAEPAVKSEPTDEEDEDEEEEENAAPKPPPKKKAAGPPKTAINTKTHRKTIPEGIPNCLEGLKLLFTGTFETMDRKTSIATAYKYGAEVITKLEDTDYIVIGTRAGPNKLKEINEKELETISEEEFFQILENGIPDEKKERMANRRLADQTEGPEEDEEDAKPKKKRTAAKGGPAKKRAKR